MAQGDTSRMVLRVEGHGNNLIEFILSYAQMSVFMLSRIYASNKESIDVMYILTMSFIDKSHR